MALLLTPWEIAQGVREFEQIKKMAAAQEAQRLAAQLAQEEIRRKDARVALKDKFCRALTCILKGVWPAHTKTTGVSM